MVVAALALATAAFAAPVALDRGFGTGGVAIADFPVSAQASVLLRQPDGMLVAIGTVDSGGFALARYDAGGAIDPSFGTDGRTLTELGRDVSVRNAAIQADGKILVAGTADGGDAAARYNPDGSLDPTFGSGGIARGDSTAATVAGAVAAATQPSAVDPSVVPADFQARFQADDLRPLALAVLPGEETLVPGSASVAGVPHLALAKLGSDGSPSRSFGSGGHALYGLAGGVGPTAVEAAAVQDDGKIVLAGPAGPTGPGPEGLVVSRYNQDGTLDHSFGAAGATVLPMAAPGGGMVAIAIEPSGRIVVARSVGPGLALTALTSAGRLDPSFGRDGRAGATVGKGSTPAGIVAAHDELLVYGRSDGRVALARYRADGSPDPSFGSGGSVVSPLAAFDAGTERAAIEADGGIIVAGSDRGRFALARFGADGSPDDGFGDHGEEISAVRGQVGAVAAGPDGGISVAGSPASGAGGGFIVARFDGSTGESAATAPAIARASTGARQPRRPRHPHRLGPPNAVPAWYINAANFQELKQFAAQDACKFARTQPKTAKRTLILDFGGARAYPNGGFGAAVNNATFGATNQQIRAALKTAADAYATCHRRGKATIAYANTNHFDVQFVALHAREIGVHQAATVAHAADYLHKAGYAPAVRAGVAGDIEMGYWGPSKSKAMVNGAESVRRRGYMDFGTAGGCPPYLKGQRRPRHHKCLNDWTLDDVAHVSNAHGGEPLPEIYYRGGRYHYDQAAQWGRVARRWNSRHATDFVFFGATGSTEFSGLTPGASWKRLKRKTIGHVGRELVNFRQDHFKPVPAARGPDAQPG